MHDQSSGKNHHWKPWFARRRQGKPPVLSLGGTQLPRVGVAPRRKRRRPAGVFCGGRVCVSVGFSSASRSRRPRIAAARTRPPRSRTVPARGAAFRPPLPHSLGDTALFVCCLLTSSASCRRVKILRFCLFSKPACRCRRSHGGPPGAVTDCRTVAYAIPGRHPVARQPFFADIIVGKSHFPT